MQVVVIQFSSSVIYIQGQCNFTITHCQELYKNPQQTITSNGLNIKFPSNFVAGIQSRDISISNTNNSVASATTKEIKKTIPMPHSFKYRKIMS